jgi:iron complex outermembrane recepter protein
MRAFKGLGAGAACLALLTAPAVFAQTAGPESSAAVPPIFLPSMTVVGNTPLPGSGIDMDKVPANVEILSAGALYPDGLKISCRAPRRATSRASISTASRVPRTSRTFSNRGFEASPIGGVPQGLAVYQNGVRINEALDPNGHGAKIQPSTL